MSDKSLEKHLAEVFESSLQMFLSVPVLERLEKAKDLFLSEDGNQRNDKELSSAMEIYAEFVEKDIKNMTDEEKADYFKNLDDKLRAYLNSEYQSILYYLPYIFWASHIIYGETFLSLTYEAREELRRKSGLDTSKKRRIAFTDFFSRFIKGNLIDTGSQSYWNEWTRLYFLSLYERFYSVLKNARNEIRKMQKAGVAVMDIKKVIVEKFHIPDELCLNVMKLSNKNEQLARNWAENKMRNDMKIETKGKMGFGDSYLIKVLQEARKDLENHIPSNHKLIYLQIGDLNLRHLTQLKKDVLKDLKFDSVLASEHPGMVLFYI